MGCGLLFFVIVVVVVVVVLGLFHVRKLVFLLFL